MTTTSTTANPARIFATPGPIRAVVTIPAGSLEFTASDRTDTTVEILPADPAGSRDLKAAERVTVEYGDGVLRIQGPARNRILGSSGAVRIVVHLPAGSQVEAEAAAAEVRSTGRLGNVAFAGAASWIKLDEVASARLTTEAGDVSIGRLDGAAEIRTGKGDIRIDRARRGTVVLHAAYGAISIGAAPGVPASLDADTSYGRVHCSLANADGHAVDLDIHASTGYGDITARSL
ncbi:DUF4097 family beta strand repeat-containing protein [Kitasatospora sp. NPDC097643]|uniref:DUF4097 family beta strand repeat-containing protein n=1 Tax=Kitasatospora sp. NPDC097643 TaxID=3157230 RepID=UPI003332EC35